ncbi:MAG TPA: ATP-binding protein [Candidatus Obscuribacterales bacterium]
MPIFRPFTRWLSRSLANQLLFTYVLLIMFALGIVSFWALRTMQSEKVDDLRNSMEVAAVHLALEIDNDLGLDSELATNRIQAATDRHANRFGYAITVVTADGHVIADSGPRNLHEGENIRSEQEINDALAGIEAIVQKHVPQTHTNWLYVAYPVRSAGQTNGVIRVGVPLTDINQRLNRDLIIFLEIIFATLIVTILISLWLARRLTRPLTNMGESAKKIAKSGDISVFVPVERNDEIGEMALSFNQMIGRLREEERLRQEFIANASHELKTPTMAIGSVVEALQAGAVEDPDLRYQFLHSLENLVERQSNLLRDLLDIAKLDGGVEKEWKEEVNVQELAQVAVEQVRPQAAKKQVAVSNETNIDGLVVYGNGIRLQRAIVNLLTNAINHTPVSGTVKLATRIIEPDKVEIMISDTGSGIDPADLPHIFERFYRGDKARTRTAGGTGLGLAITREIIARHHGTIDVDSIPGQGSTFTIRLPAKVKTAAS